MNIRDFMYYFDDQDLLELVDIHDCKNVLHLTSADILKLNYYNDYYLLRIESALGVDSLIRLYIEKR